MVPSNRVLIRHYCRVYDVFTLTLLGLQSRLGGKLLIIRLVCLLNGTAVLKAILSTTSRCNNCQRSTESATDGWSVPYERVWRTTLEATPAPKHFPVPGLPGA